MAQNGNNNKNKKDKEREDYEEIKGMINFLQETFDKKQTKKRKGVEKYF